MIYDIDPASVLFLDIETVSEKATLGELSDQFQDLWRIKAHQLSRRDPETEALSEEELGAEYRERAAIYAEFGKIVCISVGFLHRQQPDEPYVLRLKSYYGPDEEKLLNEFCALIEKSYRQPETGNRYDPPRFYFCGHNLREFDLPYICRRMLVHGLRFPPSLQLAGKKPWQLEHLLDTMELWKFGDRKHFSSLHMLATVLGFTSPKSAMDGSQVGVAFWEGQAYDEIARYCERDVLATTQLFLRYRLDDLLEESAQVISLTFDPA